MTPADAARQLDQIARDLDLVVFDLERAPRTDGDRGGDGVRRDLERLRDRLADLARALESSG